MKVQLKLLLNLLWVILFVGNSFAQEQTSFIKLNKSFRGDSKISEDNLGYLWITKNDGVYKFDGYDFKFESYESIFEEDFSGDRLTFLKKDFRNNIWLSSINGKLTKIDSTLKKTHFKHSLVKGNRIIKISAIGNSKNQVWFGSEKGEILKFNFNTQTLDSITSIQKSNGENISISDIKFINNDTFWVVSSQGNIFKYSISLNKISELKLPPNFINQKLYLAIDDNKNLWIAAEYKGLYKYIPESEKFIQYHKDGKTDKHNMFISIFYDDNGFVWAGTDGDGIFRINTLTNKVTVFKNNNDNKFSISNNTITHINKDINGNLYIVGKKGVINVLVKKNKDIKYYNGLESNSPTTVLSVFKSSDKSLWIGSDGEGLNRVLKNNNKIHYSIDSKGKSYFEGRYIQSIVEGRKGQIWIATYQNGLWVYENEKFKKIPTPDSKGKLTQEIPFLFKDSKNRIWSTTSHSVNIYNQNLELLKVFDYNSYGLKGYPSLGICEDENNIIWIVVNDGGLFKFNEVNNNLQSSYFKHIPFNLKNKSSKNKIRYITSDKNGNLWIINNSVVLTKYNIKTETLSTFENQNILKDLKITSIIPQGKENLWLSTITGIHNFNYIKDEVDSYYKTDGLQGNYFIARSNFKDNEGILYFGGDFGVNSFLPEKMSKKVSDAKLYINYLEILNKPGEEIIGDQLKNGIENLKEINLESSQSSFSFQFSAIDDLINPNYHYEYKLEGFDKDWILARKDRIATYTNIPSGNYLFKVRAGSKKGVWDISPKELKINIKPFWWNSNLAYLFYFLFISAVVYGFIVWFRLKSKLVKEMLDNNQEKEIYALKMNFFAKMSHEIQTPLTLILGPIADMLQRADSNGNNLLKQRLQMISNNANRLSRIATELMTVRNKELGKLKVYASENDLIGHLKKIATSFSEQARFKKIDLIQNYPKKEILVWYDLDKIEHVFYNLLSNAFKFTPIEGIVKIKVEENLKKGIVKISIIDSGPGIPEKDLKDIFKLFYQSDLGKSKKGTGIGLALTKELIKIHNGKIKVKSSPEEGTCFSISLSANDDVFSLKEKVYIEKPNLLPKSLDKDFEMLKKDLNAKVSKSKDKKHTLLIVEDNVEMQIFLQDILTKNYNLLIADNGKQGVELAEKVNPDLIISDIMMPVMDGVEMCTILKKKKATLHIPIILLTAKNSTSIKIKGLESGAIEFLRKPFNFYELTLKIYNILDSKEKLLSKYKLDTVSEQVNVVLPSKDIQFMENLVNELNNQIENSDFKLEELSNSLNMSYSVIYRKCLELTGKTLVEFVRYKRLKRAALLIVKNGYNVSEAAYMVGYKDSRYFSKCFKEEFGKTPKAFKTESQNTDLEDFLKKNHLTS